MERRKTQDEVRVRVKKKQGERRKGETLVLRIYSRVTRDFV